MRFHVPITIAAALLLAACKSSTDTSAIEAERDAALAAQQAAEASLAAVRTELAEARQSLQTALTDVMSKQVRIDNLTSQLSAAEAAKDQAQAALDAAMTNSLSDAAEIARLTRELAVAETSLASVRSSLAAANADRVALRMQVGDLMARVDELETDLANATDDASLPMDDEDEPDPELSRTGAYSASSSSTTQIVNGVVTRVIEQSIQITNFGYWAKIGDDTLFRAHLNASGTITNGVPNQSYSSAVAGNRSRSNPVTGSATWTGGVRGVTPDFTRVTGASRLVYDMSAETIDVSFSDFDNGQADMSWNDVGVTGGAFREGTALEGTFYGDDHEGVAGKFSRDRLRGVFSALRE